MKNATYAILIDLIMLVSVSCAYGTDETALFYKYFEQARKKDMREERYRDAKSNFIKAQDILDRQGRYKATRIRMELYEACMCLGDYKEAVEMANIVASRPGEDTYNWYYHLGDAYLAQGDFEKAMSFHRKPEEQYYDGKKVVKVDSGVGKCYLCIGNYEAALTCMKAALNTAYEHKLQSMDIAKAQINYGMVYYCMGDFARAAKMYEDALRVGPFPKDYAVAQTMLGRIAEHTNANSIALKHYRSALNALDLDRKQDKTNTISLVYTAEQSDVFNQIGQFQFRQNNLNDAVSSFREAARLRKASQSMTHPNYADTIRGLANIAAKQKELTTATLQAEESLKIMDTALLPTHPRITPTLLALSSIYELTGKFDQAASLNARIETILQKPLGPWKEDFMETAAFYAEQLKKANKPAAAQYLEQLQARQKDKR